MGKKKFWVIVKLINKQNKKIKKKYYLKQPCQQSWIMEYQLKYLCGYTI